MNITADLATEGPGPAIPTQRSSRLHRLSATFSSAGQALAAARIAATESKMASTQEEYQRIGERFLERIDR